MILNRLVDYYDRLANDPKSDIAEYGFSRQKISFVMVIKPDGTPADIQDAMVDGDNRRIPRTVVVPGLPKPSGSGINPCFLWDNAQYMLGFKADDPKPDRTLKAFEAFRERHVALEKEIADESFSAVCRFLERWSPQQAADYPKLPEFAVAFGVFRVAGAQEYVHDRPKVLDYWSKHASDNPEAPMFPSLISGDLQPIARLHEPKIKGVRGGQSSGATLVAFNADAYESYKKSQSFNAPVGTVDAFKYCTALNRLTTAPERQVHLGDTTLVYWTEKPTGFEEMMQCFFEPQMATGKPTDQPQAPAEDIAKLTQLHGFFNRLRRAADGAAFDPNESEVTFYVLGLSPNAARISVRFWLVGTVQQFAERLGQHLADMELGGAPPNMPPISIQRIIDQTARERDDIQPLLSGAISRAVLSGGCYPETLAAAVLRRIRADGQTGGPNGHIRAAILKAYLVRKDRLNNRKETVTMSLDKECPHPAYHLGRLFAALEKTQEDALGGDLNVTIKDRYFSSASANPVAAFPRLLRLHAHHLDKIGADQRGLKIVREKLVQEICDRINAAEGFPVQLPLDEQGRFFIGYYHQRQDFFTKKSNTQTTLDTDSPSQE